METFRLIIAADYAPVVVKSSSADHKFGYWFQSQLKSLPT